MAETALLSRRRAYTARIRQIFADISRAHTLRFQHALRYEFESRFESALEDAFQMGMREALRERRAPIVIDTKSYCDDPNCKGTEDNVTHFHSETP